MYSWYLVRTKPSKERYVSAQLAQLAPEVFLPLLSTAERHADPRDHIVPLFPQYVFLRCDLTAHYFPIRYVPGVSSFVTVGRDPLPVPQSVVESVRARCTNDVGPFAAKGVSTRPSSSDLTGPFRGFEAVFERYLSGAEGSPFYSMA